MRIEIEIPIEQYNEVVYENVDKLRDVVKNGTVITDGQWVVHEENFNVLGYATTGGVKCSKCGYKTHNKLHMMLGSCPFKYCPGCGSKMSNVAKEEE